MARDQRDRKIQINPIWDGEEISVFSEKTLYDFEQLKLLQIWKKFGVKGEGVKVYVIDTGCVNHPNFAHASIAIKSFIEGVRGVDKNGHGTWCSGKIVGQGVGIAPHVKLVSVKTLDDNGSGYLSWTTKALEWILDQGDADIINMSLGSTHFSYDQAKACRNLFEQGVTICCAAGNENTQMKSFPAAYQGCLAIAAYDRSKDRAWFSNYGEHIVCAAPGVSTYATYLNKNFRKLTGTSMASPTVAGILALGYSWLRKKHPDIDKRRIRDIVSNALTYTCIDLGNKGKDVYYGFGGIDGEAFMERVSEATV